MARILVIDDELEIRRLLYTVLSRKGHEVYIADEGQRGVEQFVESRPMITILDLRMPGMNGMEALEQIRAADPHALVVMLTGWYSKEAEAQARSLGAVAFLKKGFSLSELGETLRHVLIARSEMPALAR